MQRTIQQVGQVRITNAVILYGLGLVLAAVYGYVVAELVFAKLESDPGSDIHGYAALSNRYSMIMAHYVHGPMDYVLREVHFHFVYQYLSEYLADPYFALQVLAFVSAVVVFMFCVEGTLQKLGLALMILAHPRALDMLAGAQRMGIALAAFMIATRVQRMPIRYALFALAISFHTYSVVLVGAFLLYEFMLKDPSKKWKILSLVTTVGIVLVTVVLREYVLSELGDRRSGIESDTTGVLYLTMWLLTGLAVHFLVPRLIFTPQGAMFYMLLLSAAAAVALGLYAERYIAIAIVMLAASSINLRDARLLGFVGVYGLNLGLSFAYWL